MRRRAGFLPVSLIIAAGLLAAFGGLPGIGGGSGGHVASAATPVQQIGMKVLVITDSANSNGGIAYSDWTSTLQREGVKYTTLVTNSGAPGSVPLPALSSTLANGTQVANYQGVVVTISGTLGLTDAQWTTLQTFEHQFSVRQITGYAVPSSDYGLTAPNPAGGAALPLGSGLTLTGDGQKVFPYLKALAVDPTQSTWAYQGTALTGSALNGGHVDTLVSGPGNSSLLGIYTSSDGRQTMYQTFNENPSYLQSELLRHGELEWLTRGTYFGDQRNYLETDIDDNFLSDDTWSIAGNATTAAHSTDFNPADALREVPADVTNAATWSRQNGFRIDMLFNGGGSVAWAAGCTTATSGDNGTGGTSTDCSPTAPGTDPLLAQFQATDPATGRPYTGDFGWISHTWDHPNIDEGCATQNYIEAELNQNTNWAAASAGSGGNPNSGGLGLTLTPNVSNPLGNDDPNVIITGEHSGLPNLLPGNPGQVDPPALDDATAAADAASTLAAGTYVYAVSDQFNTAAPGATPVAGTGESAASVSSPVIVAAGQSVTLDWGAVCHAAGYIIYRAPYTGTAPTGTIGAWSQIGTVAANTTTDFINPASTTNTSGGGSIQKTFVDAGAAGAATGSSGTPTATTKPADEGTAVESAYEQNPSLNAAFAGTLDGGIRYFGSDASKPYPVPADGSFPTGSYTGSTVPAGGTFQDAGGTAIPRYPTNIYYNVSTNAQEVDEYTTLYDLPTCKPVTGVTTCNPAGTPFTIGQIVASVDQGMFAHMMGNDPRPHYFHQTNLMSQTNQGATGNGDGLFFETMNPLLAEYHQYFATNAPIEQPTMAQIGALLNEQTAWAGTTAITGFIQGNKVTVSNGTGAAFAIPLTGVENVGSPYEGSQSGWVAAPAGTSTYIAFNTWPTEPTNAVKVRVPNGSAPGGHPAGAAISYYAVQAAPKTVSIKQGKVRVSLACRASRGRTPKGKLCRGSFTLKVAGHPLRHTFRFKSGKVDRVTVKLTAKVRAAVAVAARRHTRKHRLTGKLTITTQLSGRKTHQSRGTLTIKA
jgi:hypothetical protein